MSIASVSLPPEAIDPAALPAAVLAAISACADTCRDTLTQLEGERERLRALIAAVQNE